MAGVGLAMRRLVAQGDLGGPLAAFGWSALLAAGPYLASSLALLALGAGAAPEAARPGLAVAAYAMALSALAFGPFQFAFARVLGDLLREGRANGFSAATAQVLGPLMAVLGLAAAAFAGALPLETGARAAAFALPLAFGGTWLALVPLSAARNYAAIGGIFAAGCALGLGLALQLGAPFGLVGLLSGLAAGQLFIFLGLIGRTDREFGAPTVPLPDLWPRLRAQGPLLLAGGAYAAALWADRVIFWFHPLAPNEAVLGPLRVCPAYDNGMALAALSTVPAIALFVLLAETDLARRVADYVATIEARAALPTVVASRNDLTGAIWRNLGLLAIVQGTVTLGVVVFSPEVVGVLGQPWLSLFVFRFGAVGAFLQVLFGAVLVHLLYLDRTEATAGLAVLFLVANIAFTLAAMGLGLPGWGLGFAAAGALSLAASLLVLDGALHDLERHLFMRQPA